MIGKSLLHYEITAKLGQGGMGEVYRARDGRLGREVAIKVLPEAFVSNAERLARFEREAQLLASLNHPNIGAIYGLEVAGESRFLVLELIEGETLAELMRKGLPLERVFDIAAQITRALETAHDRGIVHRDLKPANVKVNPEGTVKVLDYGLAKAWTPEPGDPHLSASPTLTAQMTQAGVILGTAAYMSPEQARGEEVDKRADIWAFGVLVHEMLTGESLFAGRTVTDTLAAVLKEEPDLDALPMRTPGDVRRIVARCLEKEPQKRLRDIGEARIVFEGAEPEEPSAREGVEAAAGSSRLAWGLFAGAAALALLIATLAWMGVFPPRVETPVQPVRFRAEIAPGLAFEWSPDLAFSPDGRSMAVSWTGGEGGGLHLRDLDSLELRSLADVDEARTPMFSPDGRWVAYFGSGELRKISVRGGAPLTLAKGASQSRGASWGEDGFIYYAPSTTSGLWRVAADGSEPEELTTPSTEAPEERSHRWPQFLPDGRSVLFTVQPQGSRFDEANLEILDLHTRQRITVHRGGSMGRYLPTGHLVFVRDETLYAAPFDLELRRLRQNPLPVLAGISYNPGSGGAVLAISPGGTLAYLESTEEAQEQVRLVWVAADGTTEPISSEQRGYNGPALSPDGAALLFTDGTRDASADVWSLDLERDVATRLTFTEGLDASPVWSPDGTRFAFVSNRSGRSNIWVKRADGTSEAEQLTTEGGLFQIPQDWSPDGRYILFFTVDVEGDIWVLDLETGKTEPYLNSDEASEAWPRFSPDGRWIAYVSDESGRQEVYIRPFPLGAGKWLASRGGGSEPNWSSDGTTVYYRAADLKMYAVDVAETGGSLRVGSARVLFEDRFLRRVGVSNWDVASDGGFAMLLGAEDSSAEERQLPVLVFNWFEELKRLVPLEG